MSRFQLAQAVSALRSGGVIAYPTEAIFGFGCDPCNFAAVQRLLDIKQRPVSRGLILIAADLDQLMPFLAPLSPEIEQRVLPTWPGPNTWIMPAAQQAPWWVTGEHQGIAVRVSDHPIVVELCRAFGAPIVSTSANLTGHSPTRTALQTRLRFHRLLDSVVSGDVGGRDTPSVIRNALDGSVIRGS